MGDLNLSQTIPINLAFEDDLSEEVLRKLILSSGRPYQIGNCFPGNGYGYLKTHIYGFNKAAKGMPYLVFTDLDNEECAPEKMRRWLQFPKHPNLLFRVAVKEVESWLLADRVGFAKFLGISLNLLPTDADKIDDPKRSLIELAQRSRRRTLREDLVPRRGSTAKQGPAYNDRLISFVRTRWDHLAAKENSPSLGRTVRALETFVPIWDDR
jgi:hypothetical protein